MRVSIDLKYFEKINAQFLYLTTAICCHVLHHWQPRIYNDEV